MKKKRILIASIIFILIICIVAAVFIVKNRNRSTSNTMYTYGSGDVRCNYSQDNVLYLDDSGILHLIDTASGKDMVYCDKPNCTHEGFSGSNEKPSCPAAFYGLEGAGTVLYNDHLYYVGNMSDEDMTVQYLYVMDSNVITCASEFLLFSDSSLSDLSDFFDNIIHKNKLLRIQKAKLVLFKVNLLNFHQYFHGEPFI
jgi:hypothetical protein